MIVPIIIVPPVIPNTEERSAGSPNETTVSLSPPNENSSFFNGGNVENATMTATYIPTPVNAP